MFDFLLSVALTADSFPQQKALTPSVSVPVTVSALPLVDEAVLPQISAESYLAIDVDSNERLFEKNADKKLAMASLTKLMTALITIEHHSLGEIVTVSKNAALAPGGRVYLKPGEKITVENLLKGLLIKSGNDAAVALAEYHSGTTEAFVKAMNERALALRMNNTHFVNPHGMDEIDHYSTANDLLTLTQAVWRYKELRSTVNMKEATMLSLTEKPRALQSTNKLLGENIHGVKTGTTDKAGECLILYVENGRRKMFTIVLGSKSRFYDSKQFIDAVLGKIH